LSNVTWTYFRPKGDWSEDQIIKYTENWYGKSVYGVEGPNVKFHTDYSYVHHPEFLNFTPLNAIFKLIQVTVPKEYDTLDRAIEITNDVSRDMDLGEPLVTNDGIMGDDQAQCQALLNRITVDIDMKLDMLSYQKGVKMPDRTIRNPDYNRVFDETAKRIYEVITGRGCPESVKVM
jgi:signal peptidase I